MKFVDLFCGVGGFHQSLVKYNGECVMASDIDPVAASVYKLNYGGLEPRGDIRKVDVDTIPDCDIVCGGFPCQPFSIAGKGRGLADDRGTLFHEIVRIVSAKRPKLVVLENVKRFETHDEGRSLQCVKQAIAELGYRVQHRVLNSAKFGSPQVRERVYIVAIRDDVKSTFDIARDIKESEHPVSVASIMDPTDMTDLTPIIRRKYDFVPGTRTSKNPHTSKRLFTLLTKKSKKSGQGQSIVDSAFPGVTICAKSGGAGSSTGLYHIDGRLRHLTTAESLRMFGFPDDFQWKPLVSPKRMINLLGNSVVINVLDAVFAGIFSTTELNL